MSAVSVNGKSIFRSIVALVLMWVLFLALAPTASASAPVAVQKKGSAYYLVDDAGQVVKGASSCEGLMRTAKFDGVTYYLGSGGKVEAKVKGKTYYYDNGVKMTAADAADYKTLNKARKRAAKITDPSWSKAKKLEACFNWVKGKSTIMHRKFRPTEDWPSVNANDMFDTAGGDCQGYGAAMAYLAAAIGYSESYVCNDCDGIKNEGHSWAEVNGKVYDGMFPKYNGVSYSHYFDRAYLHIKVPYYSSKNASKAQKKAAKSYKNGLYTIGKYRYFFKDGKKLKNAWKTVGKKRYYFNSKGRALTCAKKVKGVYYVFNLRGQLMKGKKTREVKVGTKTYCVSAKGRALKGWRFSRTRYYFANGERACGLVQIDGALQLFDRNTGAYKADESALLRTILAEGEDASPALALLGGADKHETSSICDLEYPDAVAHMYTYGKVTIVTRVNEPGGIEQVWTVSAA